mgnify:FL=1
MLKADDLTKGERLLLDRRRRGVSQPEAQPGVPVDVYRRWETDQFVNEWNVPLIQIDEIQAHEQLLLVRRRLGKNQTEMAEALNVSVAWLKVLETGGTQKRETVEKVLETLNELATH